MKKTIEKILARDRFNMNDLYHVLIPLLLKEKKIKAHIIKLETIFGEDEKKILIKSIVRHVFLIELVKLPKIESTKARARWCKQLNGDPRSCSFVECLAIMRQLLMQITDGWLDIPKHRKELSLFFSHPILPYEIPLDYKAASPTERIHTANNLTWVYDSGIEKALKLRAYLTGDSHMHSELFKRALNDKIKIKAYLTDRALTGVNKTNREKRWETHPAGVQFATRTSCLHVEHALLVQLCSFDGFPQELRGALQEQGVLPAELRIYRCPVTQEPMLFSEFKDELLHPRHGRSKFQIGHLNPLKYTEMRDTGGEMGHNAANIGWISEHGNRIQGYLSLAKTRELLANIARRYEEVGFT